MGNRKDRYKMKNSNKPTRSDKYSKNRTIAKVATLIAVVTVFLMFVIFGIWLLGEGDNQASNESMQQLSSSINTASTSKEQETESQSASSSINKQEDEKDEDEKESEDQDAVETEETEPSDDNVTSAITGDWKPVATEQEGPHSTNYSDGSQDRKEIKQANANATGIAVDDMIEWRVENGGDQKVVATVSDSQQTKTFRVYLTWVDNEGWRPTKVEQLKANDKR